MEQVNKKWGTLSKDPGLGGPLGGLCSILFPKKYNKKYMYQSFLPQSGILNKSIIHVVFITINIYSNELKWLDLKDMVSIYIVVPAK